MGNQCFEHSEKPSGGKKSNRMVKLLLSLFVLCISFSMMQAEELTLTGTPSGGKSLVLTVPAKIIRITHTLGTKSYTIWRNRSPFVTISSFSEKNVVKGILPPGEYTLKTLGGSVTVYLDTVFSPESIILWGRQNALVNPLLDFNYIVLSSPTTITEATYDGTKGMSIIGGMGSSQSRYLHFLSPHNLQNPGPKVLNAAGKYVAKTLIGQVLPQGVYHLVPERGTADGIVYGQVVLKVPGSTR